MSTPKKILIVEDEQDALRLVMDILRKAGYEVFGADNGEEGLKVAKDVLPDMVISDIMMPKLDGNQMLKQLRDQYFGKNIPIIILSARGGMKDYFSLLGISDFLEKPFTKAALLESVRKAFDSVKTDSATEAPKRVLIIGSHPGIVEKMAGELRTQGSHTDFVLSGEQGISKAVLFLPNIVLLQNNILDISAQEILGILRKMPQFKKIPVLIFSVPIDGGLKKEELSQAEVNNGVLIRRCLDEGATEYIGCCNEPLFMEKIAKYVKKGSVLIIDDDEGLVHLLRSAMEKEGYKVFAAKDGAAGLASARSFLPDLVILDIVMPNMDGYEVLSKLKADPAVKDIPVIIITVKGKESEIQQGLNLGVEDYMVKPVCTNLLLRRIKTFIPQH